MAAVVADSSLERGYPMSNVTPTDGQVGSSLAVVRGGPGAGVVFRYRDTENFWAVTADPDHGLWSVLRVTDGQVAQAGTVSGEVSDGTTVSVSQEEPQVLVFINGAVQLQLDDETLMAQHRSGLIAPADGSGDGRWERFFIGDLPPSP